MPRVALADDPGDERGGRQTDAEILGANDGDHTAVACPGFRQGQKDEIAERMERAENPKRTPQPRAADDAAADKRAEDGDCDSQSFANSADLLFGQSQFQQK